MRDFTACPIGEYIKEEDITVDFPKEIEISIAVCSENCGNVEFIVDGSTQVCQHCGKLMFRLRTKKYRLSDRA